MNFEEEHSEEIFFVEVQFVGCQGLCEQGKNLFHKGHVSLWRLGSISRLLIWLLFVLNSFVFGQVYSAVQEVSRFPELHFFHRIFFSKYRCFSVELVHKISLMVSFHIQMQSSIYLL